MRILVAHPGPAWSVQDVYAGWVEGLREVGQHVIEFNLGDRLVFYANAHLPDDEGNGYHPAVDDAGQAMGMAVNGLYAAVFKCKPDVLLLISAFFIPPDLMDLCRAAGIRVVALHTESPYQDQQQLNIAAHADLNLINDPLNLAAFRSLGPAEYMPQAFRPAVHRPGPVVPELACDFSFVGTGYPSRLRFLEQMDLDGLDVRLAGMWASAAESPLRRYVRHDLDECLDNARAVELYRSTAVGINLYRRETEGGGQSEAGLAMGPREVELAAVGAFFLRDPRPEGDEVLSMLPTFESPTHASELLRWYLAHAGARRRLAELARDAVADRTFANHARRLVRLLEKE